MIHDKFLENMRAERFLFHHGSDRQRSVHSISGGQQVASTIRDDAYKARLGPLGVMIIIASLARREHALNPSTR